MTARWVNIAASESLRDELDEAFPGRPRPDGTIGDAAHADSSSDHNPDETGRTPYEDTDDINEVHARDIPANARGEIAPGWTLFRVFEIIRARSAAGLERRVQNMICAGRITSRSWAFDSWRPYGGRDPHIEHGHVSFRYGSGTGPSNPENITAPWGILAAVQAEQAQQSRGDELLTVREILDGLAAELNAETPLTRVMRRLPWQYVDNGLMGGKSALFALAAANDDQEVAAALEASLETRVESAVRRALAAVPPGPISEDGLSGIVRGAVRDVLLTGVGREGEPTG